MAGFARSQERRLIDANIFARVNAGVIGNLNEIERLTIQAYSNTRPSDLVLAEIQGVAKATKALLDHLDPESDPTHG